MESHNINYFLYDFSFNSILVKFIDIVGMCNSPFSFLHHMPSHKHASFLIHSTADEHLGSFQPLANRNSALIDILVHICWYIYVKYILRSRIAMLQNGHMFRFRHKYLLDNLII